MSNQNATMFEKYTSILLYIKIHFPRERVGREKSQTKKRMNTWKVHEKIWRNEGKQIK